MQIARGIERYLGLLGVPQDGGQGAWRQLMPQPQFEQEYQALPPGSIYMAPDGTMRRKPE